MSDGSPKDLEEMLDELVRLAAGTALEDLARRCRAQCASKKRELAAVRHVIETAVIPGLSAAGVSSLVPVIDLHDELDGYPAIQRATA